MLQHFVSKNAVIGKRAHNRLAKKNRINGSAYGLDSQSNAPPVFTTNMQTRNAVLMAMSVPNTKKLENGSFRRIS